MRRYRIDAGRYGGTLVVRKTTKEFVEHWKTVEDGGYFTEDDGEKLVEYLEEVSLKEPDEAKGVLDCNGAQVPVMGFVADNENYIDEDGDVEHISGTYDDSTWTVVEVDEDDLEQGEEWELSSVEELTHREVHLTEPPEPVLCKHCGEDNSEPEEPHPVTGLRPELVPAVVWFRSEKGYHGSYFVEVDDDDEFDDTKLCFVKVETNISDLIDEVYYDGELLDRDTDNSCTWDNGNYARVGYIDLTLKDKFWGNGYGTEDIDAAFNDPDREHWIDEAGHDDEIVKEMLPQT